MNKYKYIFKRNIIMMTFLVFVIAIGIVLINNFSNIGNKSNLNIGGSFLLTDQNGKQYNSQVIKKQKLIYFGYTFCPDVCPFDIVKLSKFIDENPEKTKTTDFIFITVDPARDNSEQINSFLDGFNESIKGLTGTEEEVKKVIKDFRIFVKKNDKSKTNMNYLVDHSSLFFLLDNNDNYITHFRPSDFKSKIINYL